MVENLNKKTAFKATYIKRRKIKKQNNIMVIASDENQNFDRSYFIPGELYQIEGSVKSRKFFTGNSIKKRGLLIRKHLKKLNSTPIGVFTSPAKPEIKKHFTYSFFDWNGIQSIGGIIGSGKDLYRFLVSINNSEPLLYVGERSIKNSPYHIFLYQGRFVFTVGFLNIFVRESFQLLSA